MVQGSSLIRPRTVTGDGEGLVSHAGIARLAETADLSGLTVGLSTAMAAMPQRRHDPGRTLAQMILVLADGATCLSDLAAVRSQSSTFGPVASEATVWRTFDQIGSAELRGIDAARAAARERAWSAGAGPVGDDRPRRVGQGRRVVSRWWETCRRCASGPPNSSTVPARPARTPADHIDHARGAVVARLRPRI